MHILMLPSWYPAGTDDAHGSFFREQAETLASVGHTVGVLALAGVSVTDPRALSALRFRVQRSTEGAGLGETARNTGPHPNNTVAGEREKQTLSQGQVAVFRALGLRPVPMAHSFNLRVLTRRWGKMFDAYVRDYGTPDVLHAHAMNPGAVAAARISRRHNIPFVVTEHRADSALAELSSKSLARVLRRTASRASSRIAVSPGFAAALEAAYRDGSWRSIPNLLPQQFERMKLSSLPGRPFVFGHVSDLQRHKRVGLLLEAFASAFGNDPGVVLRIAGGPDLVSEHRRHAGRLGLQNVEFVGAVARQDIAEEFSKYHAFVMPSAAESFGVVLWEALACGVPIVATATDGGRYAVRDDTGLLVDVDDQEGLAQALVDMRANVARFDRRHLRDVCVQVCGRDEFVREYEAVYAAAMDQEL